MALIGISTIVILLVAIRLAYVSSISRKEEHITASAVMFLSAIINAFIMVGYIVLREFQLVP